MQLDLQCALRETAALAELYAATFGKAAPQDLVSPEPVRCTCLTCAYSLCDCRLLSAARHMLKWCSFGASARGHVQAEADTRTSKGAGGKDSSDDEDGRQEDQEITSLSGTPMSELTAEERLLKRYVSKFGIGSGAAPRSLLLYGTADSHCIPPTNASLFRFNLV